jgi:hypothetical protein
VELLFHLLAGLPDEEDVSSSNATGVQSGAKGSGGG